MSIQKQIELSESSFENINSKIKTNEDFDIFWEIYQIVFFVSSKIIYDKNQFNISDDDFLEKIKNEFGVDIYMESISVDWFTKAINDRLDQIIDKNNKDSLRLYFGRVYLESIDKNWIEHIDDMQRLREQVWLMWYAQLDPLVIYKKEAFEKYENLLYNIKLHTLSKIIKTDYENSYSDSNMEKEDDLQILDKIKSVVSNIKPIPQKIENIKKNKSDNMEVFFEDEDGIEILQLDDNSNISQKKEIIDLSKKKFRPNDKVTVMYENGVYDYDTKYKKVEDMIKKWKCKIIW